MLRLAALTVAAAARSRCRTQRPLALFAHARASARPNAPLVRPLSSSTTPATCPACSAPLPTPLPVCPNCSYISTIPASMSYHEMLGAPYEPNPFLVDPSALKARFRALQSIVHPDRWVGKSDAQQTAAAIMSAHINNALHHLGHPLRRVEYILEREGYGREETDSVDDPELLMQIMEAREQLAAAESVEEAQQIGAENTEILDEIISEVDRLVVAKDWPAVRSAAIKLKYLYGIDAAVASWPSQVHDH